jgi:hypothetical protein
MSTVNGNAVLFAGLEPDGETDLGDTWIWDGSTWEEVHGPHPGARDGPGMATPLSNGN